MANMTRNVMRIIHGLKNILFVRTGLCNNQDRGLAHAMTHCGFLLEKQERLVKPLVAYDGYRVSHNRK